MAVRASQMGRMWEEKGAEEAYERRKVAEPNEPRKKPIKRKRNILAKALVRARRFGRELYGGGETYLHETPYERRKRLELEGE